MSIPPRVILHVGMTKAGSTLIQNFLEARYDTLRACGWLFPRSVFGRQDPTDRSRTPGHLALLSALRTGEPSGLEAECREAGAGTLLLSIENLTLHYRPAGFDRLADLLADCHIHMVALVREQAGWLASRYYEVVTKGVIKGFPETRPFESFCSDHALEGALDYASNIADLADRFGAAELSVLDYDDLAARNSLLRGFLAATGCPLPARPEDEGRRVNVSRVCPEAIEAHRRLNCLAQNLPRDRRLVWSHAMRQHSAALMDEGRLAAAPLLPSAPLRRRLLSDIAPANRDLSERWFGGRPFGPDPGWADRPETAIDRKIVSALVADGFGLLAEHLPTDQADKRPRKGSWPVSTRNPDEAALLKSAFAKARSVLIDRVDADTVLGAAMEGKLIHALSADQAAAMSLQRQIDTAELSSPPILHVYQSGICPAIAGLWANPTFRHPDLILLVDPAALEAVCVRLTRPATLLLDGAGDMTFRDRGGRLLHPQRRAGQLAEFALTPGLMPLAAPAPVLV